MAVIIPGAFGACCVVADRPRRSATGVVSSMIMVAAMASMIIQAIAAPLLWALILLLSGLAESAAQRVNAGRRRGHLSVADSGAMTDLHRPVGSIVMAVLMVPMAVAPHDAGSTAGRTHHHSISSGDVLMLPIVLATAYVVALAVHLAVKSAPTSRWKRAETVCMLVTTGLMLAAVLIPH